MPARKSQWLAIHWYGISMVSRSCMHEEFSYSAIYSVWLMHFPVPLQNCRGRLEAPLQVICRWDRIRDRRSMNKYAKIVIGVVKPITHCGIGNMGWGIDSPLVETALHVGNVVFRLREGALIQNISCLTLQLPNSETVVDNIESLLFTSSYRDWKRCWYVRVL